MRLFLNERALTEPHVNGTTAAEAIQAILAARARYPLLAQALYCSRALPRVQLPDGRLFRDVAAVLPPDRRRLFFQWVGSRGPFLEDAREPFDDDLFLFDAEDVTDEGLGEAARQLLRGRPAGVFSLAAEAGSRFAACPLVMTHGFPDEPKATLSVLNLWDPYAAAACIAAAEPEPTRWPELLEQCRTRFPGLLIGPHCDDVLARLPFEVVVARRTIELLGVLQRMVDETGKDGALSEAGQILREQHFVGQKAWFTDAGTDEKKAFRTEMTFPSPSGAGPAMTCFWHGKIKTPQFRIHFEWPMTAPYDRLQVAYIGPKISKG